MSGLLTILDAFNWIDRVTGMISSFAHADWKGSARRSGTLGVLGAAGSAALGANTWTFSVSRDSSWSGADIEQFLKHYGIIVWGRRVTSDHYIFSVKGRQANWAEYLLQRRGIPVEGRSYNTKNAVYAQSHLPGDQPPAWADREADREKKRPDLLDSLRDIFG
jgi:hypothetical protein